MLAADEVIAHSNGHAGVAIFTDSQYQIALDKADIMKAQIERCLTCQVLAYRDTPIADATGLMPAIVHDLRSQFGSALTYLLAINGNYFAGSRAGLEKDGGRWRRGRVRPDPCARVPGRVGGGAPVPPGLAADR